MTKDRTAPRVRDGARPGVRLGRLSAAAALALALSACAGAGPRDVVLHEDQCGYCRMEVSDARFATQVRTATGKVHVFDSVECMVGYVRTAEGNAAPKGVWVADFEAPGRWVPADEAGYLVDGSVRSPMGAIVAFASPAAAAAAKARLGGTTLSWGAIREDSAGVSGHGGHGGGHGAH